jgi:hypothetical protein
MAKTNHWVTPCGSTLDCLWEQRIGAKHEQNMRFSTVPAG